MTDRKETPSRRTRQRSKSPIRRKTTQTAAGAERSRARRSASKEKKEKHVEYEFGGPVGALATTMMLPAVIFFLYFSAGEAFKFNVYNYNELFDYLKQQDLSLLWDNEATMVLVGWFFAMVALERVLPFDKRYGVKLPTGEKLMYRINGHLQFWAVFFVLTQCYPVFEGGKLLYFTHFPLSYLYDHYAQLAMAAIIFSLVFSVLLYIKSCAKGALLAAGGDTGNLIYDFFIGRELNPRIGNFDLKEFCELRPGLIGWAVINAGCALKQYELLGYVTPEMVLINLFQGLYVWDALYQEPAILTTMDITTDGFGFMLCFGDLAWVPFTYTLQARYLVQNSPGLSAPMLVGIVLLKCVGYWIFRGANSEKDAFRRDPNAPEVAHLETLTTKTGRKLLVSGWWGMARKINYTGDWFMGVAWCMTTGTDCLVTYFYAIYFFILLVHRAMRDNHACSEKYGEDWPKYRAKVPYVFLPGII